MEPYKAVIIDDEPWSRTVIRELADWDSFDIEIAGEASDGEFGLAMIRQIHPDIILTDVNMPHLSGIDLVKTMREEKNESPVIFISGYDNYEFIRSALKLDAVDYLLKPIKPAELNRQLGQCIRRLGQKEKQVDLRGDFLDPQWAEKYQGVNEVLTDVLNAGNTKTMRVKLRSIKKEALERKDEPYSKSDMIYIYYSLMHSLQSFIISRGYHPDEIFGNKNTTFVFQRSSTMLEMLDFVLDLTAHAYKRIQELMRRRNKIDIEKIKLYIKDNYTKGITLEQTAASFYVSKEYLSKVFKQEAGKGFTEYVTTLRMNRAKELILDYQVPIKEAGEMVGYMDQAHFYKTFKKFFKKTPGEIRAD